MHMLLWVLQILLALHTGMGAVWKFSNPAQKVGSLKAIPRNVWLGLSVFELICAVALILPALSRSLGMLAPLAAIGIAVEMLFFSVVHIKSGDKQHGHVVYWMVVAAICLYVAYGRLVLRPF